MVRPVRAKAAQNDEADLAAQIAALRTEIAELRGKVDQIPQIVAMAVQLAAPAKAPPIRTRKALVLEEKAAISAAISRAKGNMTEAAQLAGIPRRTFYRKVRAHGLG